jgi:serine O-acetyltransferase
VTFIDMGEAMETDEESRDDTSCRQEAATYSSYRVQLNGLVERIVKGCDDTRCYSHIDYEQLPSQAAVIEIIHKFRELLFPGYFSRSQLDPVNLRYHVGQTVSGLFDMLAEQISRGIRHECFKYNMDCSDCTERGYRHALALLKAVPDIQNVLAGDTIACYEGDPAAKSYDEIIFSYPGMLAITVHRLAHRLHEMQIPLLPRIMTEYVHGETGIDIHPGADIGERFVIDHGTGIVIGETADIGRNVRIYQGVTIGALSVPKNKSEEMRHKKRHPTIEDDVVIYSGATILGGETVIGARSVIGGNVWITEPVPPDTTVLMETPRLIYR